MRCAVVNDDPLGRNKRSPVRNISARDRVCAAARSSQTSTCRRLWRGPRSETRQVRRALPSRAESRHACRSRKWKDADRRTWPAIPRPHRENGRSECGAIWLRELLAFDAMRFAAAPASEESSCAFQRKSKPTDFQHHAVVLIFLQPVQRGERVIAAPLHMCSSAASPCALTSYCNAAKPDNFSPFSRTSGAPMAQSPSRARRKSAASSIRRALLNSWRKSGSHFS